MLRASNSSPQQMVHGVDANENDGCALSSGHSSHLQPLLVVDDALANYTFIWLPLLSKRVEVMHKGAYDTQKTICFFPKSAYPRIEAATSVRRNQDVEVTFTSRRRR